MFIDNEHICIDEHNTTNMYRDLEYIYDAIAQLQQIADVATDVESNRNEYDAVATINNTQFVVIGKSEIRASNRGIQEAIRGG